MKIICPLVIILMLFFSCKQDTSGIEVKKSGTLSSNNSDTNAKNVLIQSATVPKNISLFGESIPVHNLDIKERIDRELQVNNFWQSQTILFIKRSNRWFPLIEEILKRNGVPDDFKYLALIESGLSDVVSPSGAAGFWQFMKSTARGYELEISESIDERYNVEKATEAACKYLKEGYNKFGSWTLAAASYNMGKGGLNSRLQSQKVSSYYDLHLNRETSRYIPRIIAVKLIVSNPDKYGFIVPKEERYESYEYEEVNVDSSVTDLVSFAKAQDVSYRTLKVLNSWLRSDQLINSNNKEYLIKIPTKGFPIVSNE